MNDSGASEMGNSSNPFARSLDLNLLSEPAQVIVVTTLMERSLELLLQSKMVDGLPKKQMEKLFEGYGPLSSFSAKIDVCHAFGLLNSDQAKRLHDMRAVRNVFAHADEFLYFEHVSLKSDAKLKGNPYARNLSAFLEGGFSLFDELKPALETFQLVRAIRNNTKSRSEDSK